MIKNEIKCVLDVNCSSNPDQTMWLIRAIVDNHSVDAVRGLIVSDAVVNETYNGRTALIYAIVFNRSIYVRMLIYAGAEVNIKYDDGKTAFIDAIWFNRPIYIIRMLIDAGADVNIKNNDGVIALLYAVKNDSTYSSVDAIKMLIEADY